MNIKQVDEQFSKEFVLIHYGDTKWRPDQFGQVRNAVWRNKPAYGGGLWTSPVISDHSWKGWCESERFRVCKEEESFKLRFGVGAKLLVVDGPEDLVSVYALYKLPLLPQEQNFVFMDKGIDFEKIVEDGYDAIWLTAKGEVETRFSQPYSLYGWDCESVLILKKDKIIPL